MRSKTTPIRSPSKTKRRSAAPDGSRRLQQISTLLIQEGDLERLYARVLDAAIELMSADMGSMQTLNRNNELHLLVWKGFHPESAAYWQRVHLDSASTCGVALAEGCRIVVPDTEACDFMVGSGDLDAYRRSGIRAVQSTPLISRSGQLLGMISTHWGRPHHPKERAFRTLDVLARQAADLIERGQVEAALRESEERLGRLASIVEFSDDAIISKKLDGTITSWNKGAERLFGYSAEEAVGQPIAMLIHEDRYNEERKILERIGRGERVEHYETVRKRKDGSSIFISLTTSPVKNSEGRIVGASKVARDITDRKHAEAREKMLMAELTHMNRVATVGEVSASIAHEINQPLTVISLDAEAVRLSLSSMKLDDDLIATLDNLVSASHRASEIIRNIKSMFRKDAGDKSDVDINEMIRSVVSLVEADLRKHHVNLKMELDEPLPRILANGIQIQQVILNLFMNAVDAVRSEHSPFLSVKSKLSSRESVRVLIEDTGIGIAPAHADKIFEPMFTTKEHGIGMGLSICRTIIERHGGRIWASPGDSGGALFQFELPTRFEK